MQQSQPVASHAIDSTQSITFRNQQFDTYSLPYLDADIRFYLNDDEGKKIGSLGRLRDFLHAKNQNLLFATNGGMYMRNQEPQGLFIEKGETKRRLDTFTGNGNFHLKPNGVFYLTETYAGVTVTEDFEAIKDTVVYATQSGPMLVIEGNIHPKFTEGSKNLHIRSGVGILPDSSIVFAISKKTVNFYDFASLFRDHFHCENALYLDGFVSKMYLPALGREDSTGNFGVIIGVSQ